MPLSVSHSLYRPFESPSAPSPAPPDSSSYRSSPIRPLDISGTSFPSPFLDIPAAVSSPPSPLLLPAKPRLPFSHLTSAFLLHPVYIVLHVLLLLLCIALFALEITGAACLLFSSFSCPLPMPSSLSPTPSSQLSSLLLFLLAIFTTACYGVDIAIRYVADSRGFLSRSSHRLDLLAFTACLVMSVVVYCVPLQLLARLVTAGLRYLFQLIRILLVVQVQRERSRILRIADATPVHFDHQEDGRETGQKEGEDEDDEVREEGMLHDDEEAKQQSAVFTSSLHAPLLHEADAATSISILVNGSSSGSRAEHDSSANFVQQLHMQRQLQQPQRATAVDDDDEEEEDDDDDDEDLQAEHISYIRHQLRQDALRASFSA